MPKNLSSAFNAAAEVEDLTYDFTKYVEGAQGVIPEPSGKQIVDFQSNIRIVTGPARKLFMEAKKLDANEASDIEVTLRMMDSLGDEADASARTLMTGMAKAAGALCSGTPSAAVIEQLPWRVQKAFIGWLAGQFTDPES